MTLARHDAPAASLPDTRPGKGPVNIAAQLTAMAARYPDKRAVVWTAGRDASGRARYADVTFAALEQETDRYAYGLEHVGVTRGTRTIVFLTPGPDFFALVFALFKVGAVPVMIDPGIGRRQMRMCLAAVRGEAFIGVPRAHVFRTLYPGSFRSVRVAVTVGRRWFWGGLRRADIRSDPWRRYEPVPTTEHDPAAILFTSGSTGPAKGVLYEHGMFDAQVRYLHSHFGYSAEDVDLPTFPLFALFDVALGMTAVIPEMDFSRPGSVEPSKIIEPIGDHGVTHMFGSPALLDRVSRYGEAHGTTLPTLERVVTAGAPVPPAVLERMHAMLGPEAEVHTPYGATEALPVASIGSREILGDTAERTKRGAGTCVGVPMDGLDVRIIRIDDAAIANWSDDLELPAGDIGEITVTGSVVTRTYHNDPGATALAKIAHGSSTRHRMGDVGYVDGTGRLWFCGRKAHRVVTRTGTLFTVPCEAMFNQHPRVCRSALVGIGEAGRQLPVICIQLEGDDTGADTAALTRELLTLAAADARTREITTLLFHQAFPVDARHNSKIVREKLAIWAKEQVR
jgi:acyl-CoA synthetase (AMP-forming)/AMP-acid ligase II